MKSKLYKNLNSSPKIIWLQCAERQLIDLQARYMAECPIKKEFRSAPTYWKVKSSTQRRLTMCIEMVPFALRVKNTEFCSKIWYIRLIIWGWFQSCSDWYEWNTVRPQDTRPQAARTLTMHVFEYGPKKFEMHKFM